MITHPRAVVRIIEPEPVVEGAGVRLRRSIGTRTLDYLDPFLLLDHFASTDGDDYRAGFPMHPHRGIETVTYLLAGSVRHRDTIGSSGRLAAGGVQWMTAGRGILHEEMPEVRPEGIDGFQLWVNLPAALKMTQPRYQDIPGDRVPEVQGQGGTKIRVIAGSTGRVQGPIQGIAADPLFLDVEVPPGVSFVHRIEKGHAAFAYVFRGQARFGGAGAAGTLVGHTRLAVFGDGESIEAATERDPVRFLLVAARPLGEPIARYGPFVMNTRAEIEETLRQIRSGNFP